MKEVARKLMALGVMFFILLAAATARAADSVTGEIISVGIGGSNGQGGTYRPGSWVPVQVRLKNHSPSALVARLGVDQNQHDLDGDRVTSVGPEFTLNAGVAEDRTVWTYYWPSPDDDGQGINTVAVLDKSGTQMLGTIKAGQLQPARSVPDKDQESGRSFRWVVVLGKTDAGWKNFENSAGGTEATMVTHVADASALPDDVKGFDGVDVIVWEADVVKVHEVPSEFQLKAMLEWVKSGGHLIISVGNQWQEFAHSDSHMLVEAMPLTLEGTRTANWDDIKSDAGWQGAAMRQLDHKTFDQAIGKLKPTARPVRSPAHGFENAPMVVTGLYGQGAVTVVTFDVTNPDAGFSGKDWAWFWTESAGWVWVGSDFWTAADLNDPKHKDDKDFTSPGTVALGRSIPQAVDVTGMTNTRILVAVLFLGIYWLLAGPIGHLILRAYKLIHWSWWVFGGTVLIATAVAGVVVMTMHVTASEVRFRSFVLGRVNSKDASVSSYYGVYSPSSGMLEVKQPDSSGMSYLVPLCFPQLDVKAYADPQSYQIFPEHAGSFSPVWRQTLKKMQGRWNGQLAGISGTAAFGDSLEHLLKGTLVNQSGYNLAEVQCFVYVPRLGRQNPSYGPGFCYLYDVRTWKAGEAISLEDRAALVPLDNALPKSAEDLIFGARVTEMLERMPRDMVTISTVGGRHGFGGMTTAADPLKPVYDRYPYGDTSTSKYHPDDLLYTLLDERAPDDLKAESRTEVARGIGRLTDCTKELHAACALIVAHAGSVDAPVKCPVPLTIGGSEPPSKGDVVFAWALPVEGELPVLRNLPVSPPGTKPATNPER